MLFWMDLFQSSLLLENYLSDKNFRYAIVSFLLTYLTSFVKTFAYPSVAYSPHFLMKIWGAGLCGWVVPVSPLEVMLA